MYIIDQITTITINYIEHNIEWQCFIFVAEDVECNIREVDRYNSELLFLRGICLLINIRIVERNMNAHKRLYYVTRML